MITMKKTLPMALCLLALFPSESIADDFLNLSVGYYDVLDDHDGADFRLEYRPDIALLGENLKPFIGGEVTSKGSLWGGGGMLYDLNITDNIYLTPSAGIGLYTNGDSDVDLDYPLQLRSQLEISYELLTENRISLSLSHMSNAGLGDSNPGTETISLGYSYALK